MHGQQNVKIPQTCFGRHSGHPQGNALIQEYTYTNHRRNNFNSKDINNYPLLAHIYIT